MTYVVPEDRPRRPQFHWGSLSKSAQLALVLIGLYLVEVALDLANFGPWIVRAFGLTASPLHVGLVCQLFTYALIHSFEDPLHVVLNAVLLYFCGSVVEGERGPRSMIVVFTVGVVAGGLAFTGLEILRSTQSWPLVGASGGCYALLAAAAFLDPNLPTLLRIPLWVLAAFFVGIDALRFLMSVKSGGLTSVSYVAHLGGALAGLGLAWRGISDERWPRLRGLRLRERWERYRAQRRLEQEASRARRLDGILEKIHREGIGALTASERAFLKDASRSLKGPRGRELHEMSTWMGSDETG